MRINEFHIYCLLHQQLVKHEKNYHYSQIIEKQNDTSSSFPLKKLAFVLVDLKYICNN